MTTHDASDNKGATPERETPAPSGRRRRGILRARRTPQEMQAALDSSRSEDQRALFRGTTHPVTRGGIQ